MAAARRFRPARVPAPRGPSLLSALAREHARWPFSPTDVRDAARRIVAVLGAEGADCVTVRGGLDVGGAELDHVWVVADGFVVDMALPVRSARFVDALRAFVAGDLEVGDLERVAHGYPLDRRVLGDFPSELRYVGRPVFSQRSR